MRPPTEQYRRGYSNGLQVGIFIGGLAMGLIAIAWLWLTKGVWP